MEKKYVQKEISYKLKLKECKKNKSDYILMSN